MKQAKKYICSLLALLLWISSTAPAFALSFPDVNETADYAKMVDYISDRSIMVGDEKGCFNPDKMVTRAEMAVIMCKMLGETENLTKSDTFTDVPQEHWANAYIARAEELGVISGYGDGRFGPGDTVTYEQALTMVIRALGGEALATDYGGYPTGYVTLSKMHGFVDGVTCGEGDPLPRSEIAVVLYLSDNFYFSDTIGEDQYE